MQYNIELFRHYERLKELYHECKKQITQGQEGTPMNQSITGNGNSISTSGSSGVSIVQINDVTIKATKNKLIIETSSKDLAIEVNGVKYAPVERSK